MMLSFGERKAGRKEGLMERKFWPLKRPREGLDALAPCHPADIGLSLRYLTLPYLMSRYLRYSLFCNQIGYIMRVVTRPYL